MSQRSQGSDRDEQLILSFFKHGLRMKICIAFWKLYGKKAISAGWQKKGNKRNRVETKAETGEHKEQV